MDFASDHSLALVYSTTNYKYSVLNLNETTGNTIQDLTYTQTTGTALNNIEGCIRMDPITSNRWYAAIKDVISTSHERVYLTSGTHAYSTTTALTYSTYYNFGTFYLRHP
jgi:restriction endonuclease Mrr